MGVVSRGAGTGWWGWCLWDALGSFHGPGATSLQVCIPEISQVCTQATQLDPGAEVLACNVSLRKDRPCPSWARRGGLGPGEGAASRGPGPGFAESPPLCSCSLRSVRSSDRAPCPWLLSASSAGMSQLLFAAVPGASPCAARTLGGLEHRLCWQLPAFIHSFWWAPVFKLQADSKTWRCL